MKLENRGSYCNLHIVEKILSPHPMWFKSSRNRRQLHAHSEDSRNLELIEMSAAAAGAAISKSHEYDVFINHRGTDAKKTFVAHLYVALSRCGTRPFLDAEDIWYALPVSEEIDKALKGACVHVAIFSKRYAESIYCLDELCAMLKSKQRIIPVYL